MKIGFIGLGIMGSRMAANLLKKGHELIVHNRTKDKAQPFSTRAHPGPRRLRTWQRTLTSFYDASKPDAVAEVALIGKHSFLHKLPQNRFGSTAVP